MHAVSTNQVVDILHFNNKYFYSMHYMYSLRMYVFMDAYF